ncbi:ribonuclease H-like domain-containing protein [Vararia minispora EC-137]|uniref:Ribonuclease H-like domain-containing protein n=1 Tax=Vararia minispora EC-137 TaxID=1314806 RepID=A0ACB8QSQ9_9AGAM|nr:ribonuclease H-like domain-containing protein [Vararia minispora EC-137]
MPTRRFTPPNPTDRPVDLFVPQTHPTAHKPRFVRRSNYKELLIYIDGACMNNGAAGARAGWAFVFHPSLPSANVSAALELRGPDGREHPQTNNRAELRAAIGALHFRFWPGEGGFRRIVLATDSEYVVLGITERIRQWEQNGWRTRAGSAVANRDLWEELLKCVQDLEEQGAQPVFWLIPRELITAADRMAKEAALRAEQSPKFDRIVGSLV